MTLGSENSKQNLSSETFLIFSILFILCSYMCWICYNVNKIPIITLTRMTWWLSKVCNMYSYLTENSK
jgi:hypothetical protein